MIFMTLLGSFKKPDGKSYVVHKYRLEWLGALTVLQSKSIRRIKVIFPETNRYEVTYKLQMILAVSGKLRTCKGREAALGCGPGVNAIPWFSRHEYFCDRAGDERVDSVDEIAARRTSLLTAEEKLSFDPFTDEDKNQRAWQDGDGDGTICNSEEAWSGDFQGIRELTLSVYPPGD
jgi:hypothetical protein